VLVRKLAEVGDASGYRVDALREALASGGTAVSSPAAGRTSRLPKATGLPPGPNDAPGPGDDGPKPGSRKDGPPSG
jgi:hypothetical protein